MGDVRPAPARLERRSGLVVVLDLDSRSIVFRNLNESVENVLCDNIVLTRIQRMRERRYLVQ